MSDSELFQTKEDAFTSNVNRRGLEKMCLQIITPREKIDENRIKRSHESTFSDNLFDV